MMFTFFVNQNSHILFDCVDKLVLCSFCYWALFNEGSSQRECDSLDWRMETLEKGREIKANSSMFCLCARERSVIMMVMIFIACYNMCLSYILGTVYQKYEPIFFQSIGNPFIFRCLDGVLIDGNDKGISKVVYR